MYWLSDLLKLLCAATGVGVAVGILASTCARRQAFVGFVIGICVLAFLAVAYFQYYSAVHFSSSYTSRENLYAAFNALSVAPAAILFIVWPGKLVKRGAAAWKLFLAAIATSVAASPIWVLYGVALGCGMGIDCL